MSGQRKLAKGQVRAQLLPPADPSWSAEDWRARYDERAGTAEHVGGLSRIDAEHEAFQSCIAEWLSANPSPSPANQCGWCGKLQTVRAPVLPFGTEPGTWLHAECWKAWYRARCAEAAKSLANRGVIEPQTDGVQRNPLAAPRRARS